MEIPRLFSQMKPGIFSIITRLEIVLNCTLLARLAIMQLRRFGVADMELSLVKRQMDSFWLMNWDTPFALMIVIPSISFQLNKIMS